MDGNFNCHFRPVFVSPARRAKRASKGRDSYKTMESYREDRKTRHRVVQNIGTLSMRWTGEVPSDTLEGPVGPVAGRTAPE